jgi:hypothetical protein
MSNWHWSQMLDVSHAYFILYVVFLHNEIMVMITINFLVQMVIATRKTV